MNLQDLFYILAIVYFLLASLAFLMITIAVLWIVRKFNRLQRNLETKTLVFRTLGRQLKKFLQISH